MVVKMSFFFSKTQINCDYFLFGTICCQEKQTNKYTISATDEGRILILAVMILMG